MKRHYWFVAACLGGVLLCPWPALAACSQAVTTVAGIKTVTLVATGNGETCTWEDPENTGQFHAQSVTGLAVPGLGILNHSVAYGAFSAATYSGSGELFLNTLGCNTENLTLSCSDSDPQPLGGGSGGSYALCTVAVTRAATATAVCIFGPG